MIHYSIDAENKKTYAVLTGTENDAFNAANKLLRANNISCLFTEGVACSKFSYLTMPSKFVSCVTHQEPDVYSQEEGMKQAKMKVMKSYYKSMDERMARFIDDVISTSTELVKKMTDIKASKLSE